MVSFWKFSQKNTKKGSVIPLIFLVIVIAAGAYYYFGQNKLSIKLIPKGEEITETEVADASGVNEINNDPENTAKPTALISTPQSRYTSKSGLWSIAYPITWRVDGAIGESATFSSYGDDPAQASKPIISVSVALSDSATDLGAEIDKGLQAMNDDLTQTYTKEPITVTGGKGNRIVYYDKTGQTKITKVLYVFPLNVKDKKAYLVGRVELFDSKKSTYKPGLLVADSITLNLSKATAALQAR